MSNFVPSPAELALTTHIFALSDPQKLGIVTGDAAVKVFARSNLPATILGEIWAIADKDNNGFLTKKGVTVALRLLGWAQKGESVTEALVNKPGPLPTLDGIPSVSGPQRTIGSPAPKSPPPGPIAGFPPLTLQDKAKFQKLFAGVEPVNGLLSGEKARDVFVKSKLPFNQLSQIWSLADTQDRGALDVVDFTVGMYLIQALMSGRISTLPPSLPSGLYEQAGGKTPFDSVTTHLTGASLSATPSVGSFFPGAGGAAGSRPPFPSAPVQQEFTGQRPIQAQTTGQALAPTSAPRLPTRSGAGSLSGFGSLGSPFPAIQQLWDVSAEEKATTDKFFDGLDSLRRGYIEGDVAVPFMLQSQLSEDILAQVWDLADLNNDGRLTREGFAVAMHLINGKLAGKEIPTTLPPTLIPLSMRATSANPGPVPIQAPPEPHRDLLWDESPPQSATFQQPESASASMFPPPSAAHMQSHTTGQLSHQPTSAYSAGSPVQTVSHQPTGLQSPFGGSSFAVPHTGHKDLLGDDDEHTAASISLHHNSAEIGNVQNQLNSTNRSLETTKTERASVEQNIANQAGQLSALQTQLSSAKAAYETETRLFAVLRERFTAQSSDIQKAREELIRAESDLSALKAEKAEIEGAFLRDKEEVRDLQRKMKEIGDQVDGIKVDLEKTRKESKQQKGLLAIARKQLSTREAERTKVVKELEEASAEVLVATKERELAEVDLVTQFDGADTKGDSSGNIIGLDTPTLAASRSLPMSPPVGSVSSASKNNNPFERLAMGSGSSTPRSQSPFLPFANNSVPTPTASLSASAADDPFGFTEDAAAGTQTVNADRRLSGEDHISPMSPTDDALFSTPPTSSVTLSRSHSPQEPTPSDKSTILASDAARFPPIESHFPDMFSEPEQSSGTTADFSHHIKEFEVDESDSDSDAEGPLTNGVVDKGKAPEGTNFIASSQLLTHGSAPSPTNLTSSVTSSTFDDMFGPSRSAADSTADSTAPSGTATSPPLSGKSSPLRSPSPSGALSARSLSSHPKDVFGVPVAQTTTPFEPPVGESVPPPTIETVLEPNAQLAAAAGVSDFDEAMSRMPTSTTDTQFKFEAAFDDNFDFSAVGRENTFPPPPSVNGKKDTAPSSGFDSVFGTGSPAKANGATPVFPPLHVVQPPLSFDDAFGGTVATSTAPPPISESQAVDDTFGSSQGQSDPVNFQDAFTAMPSKLPAVTSSAVSSSPFPTSPSALGSPSFERPSSPATGWSSSQPPRNNTPPPRVASPKHRSSTGSSKETSPSDKASMPIRHSRLSIRLPFGSKNKDKKKSKQETPPVPLLQQHLTPVAEAASNSVTPAVEDDVESVKQLCGMGFSRTQAVLALEAHGYDVQKALNYLLGAR